jgi:exosortase E/protease (VPEID-CTERM system)
LILARWFAAFHADHRADQLHGTSMNARPGDSDRPSLPYCRWSVLIALLAAEIVSVSVRFDTDTASTGQPWHGLVVHFATISRLALAAALATLLIAWPSGCREWKRYSERRKRFPGMFPALLGNLAAFGAFFWLSVPIFEGGGSADSSEWLLFAAWTASGLLTLAFWGLALLPGHLWRSMARQSGWSLVVGPLLGGAAWAAGLLARDQWKHLSRATLWLVHGMLSLFFSNTICRADEGLVGTSSFSVLIAPQCSGYEGMGLMAVLLAIFLGMFRRDLRFPRSLLLLPVGIVFMWLAHTLRIAALLVLGTLGYTELASGGFHSLAGWILFLAIGLGLMACARGMAFFSKVSLRDTTSRSILDRAYLLPALSTIAIAMFTGTFAHGFDRYYPARIIAAILVMAYYRRSYAELRLNWSWEAVVIGCGVFALWMALEPYDPDQIGGQAIRSGLNSLSREGAAFWMFCRVVGSVIAIPLAEELAFRGYLSRRLISADFEAVPPGRFTVWSFLISSVLFGALHGRWLAGTLAGMAFALVYRRRGELSDAVVAHGVANALIAAAVFLQGAWSLWA